jgi:hypothetical protein
VIFYFRFKDQRDIILTGIGVWVELALNRKKEIKEMAKVKVLAGDFLEADGQYSLGSLILKTKEHSWLGETIPLVQLDTVDIATEENVKKIGGTVGWGAAGAIILGPVGLLAGLLLGGRKKEVTFVAKFKDGRKLMAQTDSKTFTKLQAAVF